MDSSMLFKSSKKSLGHLGWIIPKEAWVEPQEVFVHEHVVYKAPKSSFVNSTTGMRPGLFYCAEEKINKLGKSAALGNRFFESLGV